MNLLPFLIAKKMLLKEKKNYTIFFIIILSRIGIFISVFALIMSFSALNGFQELINQKILSTMPHAIIQTTDQSNVSGQEIIKKINMFPEIDYAEPYILTSGLLNINQKVKTVEIKSFSDIKFFKKKNVSLYDHNIHLKKKMLIELLFPLTYQKIYQSK